MEPDKKGNHLCKKSYRNILVQTHFKMKSTQTQTKNDVGEVKCFECSKLKGIVATLKKDLSQKDKENGQILSALNMKSIKINDVDDALEKKSMEQSSILAQYSKDSASYNMKINDLEDELEKKHREQIAIGEQHSEEVLDLQATITMLEETVAMYKSNEHILLKKQDIDSAELTRRADLLDNYETSIHILNDEIGKLQLENKNFAIMEQKYRTLMESSKASEESLIAIRGDIYKSHAILNSILQKVSTQDPKGAVSLEILIKMLQKSEEECINVRNHSKEIERKYTTCVRDYDILETLLHKNIKSQADIQRYLSSIYQSGLQGLLRDLAYVMPHLNNNTKPTRLECNFQIEFLNVELLKVIAHFENVRKFENDIVQVFHNKSYSLIMETVPTIPWQLPVSILHMSYYSVMTELFKCKSQMLTLHPQYMPPQLYPPQFFVPAPQSVLPAVNSVIICDMPNVDTRNNNRANTPNNNSHVPVQSYSSTDSRTGSITNDMKPSDSTTSSQSDVRGADIYYEPSNIPNVENVEEFIKLEEVQCASNNNMENVDSTEIITTTIEATNTTSNNNIENVDPTDNIISTIETIDTTSNINIENVNPTEIITTTIEATDTTNNINNANNTATYTDTIPADSDNTREDDTNTVRSSSTDYHSAPSISFSIKSKKLSAAKNNEFFPKSPVASINGLDSFKKCPVQDVADTSTKKIVLPDYFKTFQVDNDETAEQSQHRNDKHVNDNNIELATSIVENNKTDDYIMKKLKNKETLMKLFLYIKSNLEPASDLTDEILVDALLVVKKRIALQGKTKREILRFVSDYLRENKSLLAVTQRNSSLCSICFVSNHTQPSEMLACNHTFHTECLQKWFQSDKICPVCRKLVVPKEDDCQ